MYEVRNCDISQALSNLCLPNGTNDIAEVREYLDIYQVEELASRVTDILEQTYLAIDDIEDQISSQC